MKLDLLTNAIVVNDAMKFVSDYFNNNNKRLISKKVNNGESKEPDYDEKDSPYKQEEELQEKNIGETNQLSTAATTNQVF
jgi:hypothetical protein